MMIVIEEIVITGPVTATEEIEIEIGITETTGTEGTGIEIIGIMTGTEGTETGETLMTGGTVIGNTTAIEGTETETGEIGIGMMTETGETDGIGTEGTEMMTETRIEREEIETDVIRKKNLQNASLSMTVLIAKRKRKSKCSTHIELC